MSSETFSPATILFPLDGRTCLVAGGRPHSWKIGQFDDPNTEALKNIRLLGSTAGARRIFAPYVGHCTARIARTAECTRSIRLDESNDPLTILGYPNADGIELLRPGDAFYMAAGDCPPITAHNTENDRIVVAHGARDSLIERALCTHGRSQREHVSVVDAIMDWHKPVSPRNIRVFIGPGIIRDFVHAFDDPTHGPINRSRYEHLAQIVGSEDADVCMPKREKDGKRVINLPRLIEKLFAVHGVTDVRFSNIDTSYNEADEWYSCARGDTGRHGILIARR